ncbi:hypothetical protein K431DRAFT_171401 [Polychaeton citri CBS 116435]|uniref:Uncharacterized protein n=1 Tax=Polychaeton citri CBS 116435 TaxID=1314669 RepID=A0A9P4Q1P1_9PEZI|nr:hypothetical protein K431DRAFT_171401 [Polychaeton citri CBS 116435]
MHRSRLGVGRESKCRLAVRRQVWCAIVVLQCGTNTKCRSRMAVDPVAFQRYKPLHKGQTHSFSQGSDAPQTTQHHRQHPHDSRCKGSVEELTASYSRCVTSTTRHLKKCLSGL